MRADLPGIARHYGATVALRTALSTAGDSLVLTAGLIDIATRKTQSAGRYVFSAGDMLDVSSRLSAVVAGLLFRATNPQAPHAAPGETRNSESFRLAMSAWYSLLNDKGPKAESLFLAARELDPLSARAWAGLSSVYALRVINGTEEWTAAVQRAEDAGRRAMFLDSLEGTPLGNMAIILALRTRHLAPAESLLARAIALDPGNAELYVIKGAMYRHAWQFDKARDAFRIARQLDPLAPGILDREADLELCAGRNHVALDLARAEVVAYPTDPSKHRRVARVLARMSRWTDALAQLRLADIVPASTFDSVASSGITAEAAYWEIAERPWRVQLANAERAAARNEFVNPNNLAALHVAAGDLDAGMSLLEKFARSGDPLLNKVPCLVQVDRIRGTPRYNAIIASVPKWAP
jgi:tetratricopeptide (TPR) repeat protein